MAIPTPDQAVSNSHVLLEHRRELFKIEDSRIAAVEVQASAVIAATIAVLAFFVASEESALGVWAAALSAGAVALFAGLVTRMDSPFGTGTKGKKLRQDVIDADRAVSGLELRLADPVHVRHTCAGAWRMRYRSAAWRLEVKRKWLLRAQLALAVLFLISVAAT